VEFSRSSASVLDTCVLQLGLCIASTNQVAVNFACDSRAGYSIPRDRKAGISAAGKYVTCAKSAEIPESKIWLNT
jgi:hypothetical protein